MIIKKIKIINFFCFVDDNEFLFEKGLNIISSPNSGGKSMLFNAFYWTFFDKIYIDSEINNGKKEWKSSRNLILFPSSYKNKPSNEKLTTSVVIDLEAEHPNDEHELVTYTFEKTVIYEKIKNELTIFSKPQLEISYIDNGETKFIAPALHNLALANIFPESIRKFLWFQGETVDELYNFSQPNTLKFAIKEISYYPIYDNMKKIVESASLSIEKKVRKEMDLKKMLTSEQNQALREITTIETSIKSLEEKITKLDSEVADLDNLINQEENKFKSYDQFTTIKRDLDKKEYELKYAKQELENIDIYVKEKLINKWMLIGTDKMISDSEEKLKIIQKEIQKYTKTTNPVPMSLPGPEYVQKMIKDKVCYICEREVLEDSPSYEALKRRLNDFEKSAKYKNLQDNYTDLNRIRRVMLEDLSEIKKEINDNIKKRENLIKKRNNANKEINQIIKSAGEDGIENIKSRGITAGQILSKLNTYKTENERKKSLLTRLNSDLNQLSYNLIQQKNKADKILDESSDKELPEYKASKYIKFFVKIMSHLCNEAYEKFIVDLKNESNKLYSLYLGGKQQGEIIINDGINVIDFASKETLTNLNTAELVAQKLAIANSFLSLNEKKRNKNYPLVADAPTSDLDPQNTINLTMNIGKSFEQIIIMSKDYGGLSKVERSKLLVDAKVSKFYELKNDLIDINGVNSRSNKKTYTTKIK